MTKQPFGEVIASNLDRCTLQSWEWDTYPAYGSLVHIKEEDGTLIGIVEGITTAPLDGSRTPIAYKKTEAELKAEHPHIFALLRTTIITTILGIKMPQNICISPTKPARIHTFGFQASNELSAQEIKLALGRIITLHEPHHADILIQQYLHHQKSAGTLSGESLRSLITAYIETVGSDYKRIFNFNRFVQTL